MQTVPSCGMSSRPPANPDMHTSYPPYPYATHEMTTHKTYRRGHPYWFDQTSASGNVAIGCYVEGGQPKWAAPVTTLVFGPATFIPDEAATQLKGGGFYGPKLIIDSAPDSDVPFTTTISRTGDEAITFIADGDHTAGLAMIMDSTTDGCWGFMHARTQTPLKFTTNLTTLEPTGLSAPIAAGHTVFGRGIWLGNTDANLRQLQFSNLVPTTLEHAAGEIVFNSNVTGVGSGLGWRCITSGTPGTWQALQVRSGHQTINTDVNFTLTPATSPFYTLHTGTLTANRTVTLSTTGDIAGQAFRIARSGGGAFSLNIGGGTPLKALATDQWCEVTSDGTLWYLSAFGSL